MDPKQTPPGGINSANTSTSATGINSASASASATGASIFANPRNRFNPNTATSSAINAGSTNPQGDILLPASNPTQKSSTKNPFAGIKLSKPLILIIIAAIAIVVMLVLTSVLGSGGSGGLFGGNNNTVSDTDLKTAFNRYANYAISGTDSTEDLTGEYDSSVSYAITDAVAERNVEYFDTAKTYLDNFLELYDQNLENIRTAEDADEDESEDEDADAYSYSTTTTYQAIEEYRAAFEFIADYVAVGDLAEEDLLAEFMDSDKEGSYAYIEDHYSSLSEQDYEEGSNYINAKIAYDKAMVDTFVIYSSEGCISQGGDIDEVCLSQINYDNYDISGIIEAASSEDISLKSSIVSYLASGCYDISRYLGAASDMPGDTVDPIPSDEEDATL